MGLAEACVWIVISAVLFAIFLVLGWFGEHSDHEGSLALSLFISCFCLGFCITYILQMKGML